MQGAVGGRAEFEDRIIQHHTVHSTQRRMVCVRRTHLAAYVIVGPGLTALAFSEKKNLAHDKNSNERLFGAQSLPTYLLTTTQMHVPKGAGEHGAPNEVRTSYRDGLTMNRDLRTVFEPLAWPLSASPLLARQPRETLDCEDPPVTQSAGTSRYVSPLDETTRRRYMDGGVRIAGGPPIRRLSPDGL